MIKMNHMRKMMRLAQEGDEYRDRDGAETKLSAFNKLAELL